MLPSRRKEPNSLSTTSQCCGTDFFKPHHVEQNPGLHDLFWNAIKQAGDAKKSMDPEVSQKLIDLIGDVSEAFWQTEESKAAGVYPPA